MAFQKAVKRKMKGRVAICGPTGSGKTWTGLQLLRSLVGKKGRIAVIDTENRTASKYLGEAIDTFDADEFDTFEPQRYIKAIQEAAKAGYDGLLIDSLTHAWAGKGGALEQVDAVAARLATQYRSGKADNFAAWREVTPIHNDLVETLIRFPGHLVVTMRSKMAYEKGEGGKIQKLGMAPIQRDGLEYEFDVVCDMDVAHNLVVSKTRCKALDGKLFKKPEGETLAKPILKWLNDGADAPPPPKEEVLTDEDRRESEERLRAEVERRSQPDPDPLSPGVDVPAMDKIKEAATILGGEIEVTFRITGVPAHDQASEASALIGSAKNMEHLKEIGARIKGLDKITAEDRKALLAMWREREKQFKGVK